MAHKSKRNVHDRFVRRNLSDLSMVKTILERFLAGPFRDALDLEQLRSAKETYVGAELDERITDLLFAVPFRERAAFVSLLIEHKSKGAAGKGVPLPFQLRSQEIRIMEHGYRNHEQGLFPLVYPIGLYHGPKPYGDTRSVGKKIDAPAHLIPDRWQEEMVLIDLATIDDETLISEGKAGIFLLVLKYIYDDNIEVILRRLIPEMQKVEKMQDGVVFLMTLFRYLYEASRMKNRQVLDEIAVKSFSEETGGKLMTLAEQIIEEARPQIIKEARPQIIKEAEPLIIKKVRPQIIKEAEPLR